MTRHWFLLFLPFLMTGCLTGKVIDSAQSPDVRIKKDTLYAIKGAYVTDDHILLVQVEAGIGDESRHGQYTLSVPLTLHFDEWRDQKARIKLPRSAVHPGWEIDRWKDSNPREITVAPPIVLRSGASYDFKTLGVQPGKTQTLYLIQKPIDYLNWELVFATRTPGIQDVKYSLFELKEETTSKSNGAYYLALPFSIIFDIATCPFQIAYKAIKG